MPTTTTTTTHEIEVDAVLLDMDGTIIDSTPAVNQTWAEYIERYNLDGPFVMANCHGCRTIENLRRFIPEIKEEDLEQGVRDFEGRIKDIAVEAARTDGPGKIISLPGSKKLLEQLSSGRNSNPLNRAGWAIATSATAAYAHVAFEAAQCGPAPEVFVTSDLVSKGKPDPEPYLLAAKLLGADPKRCLVVEDAPPGVVAGKASGGKVLGLKTTHDDGIIWQRGADYVVPDLSYVSARWEGERLIITIQSDARP